LWPRSTRCSAWPKWLDRDGRFEEELRLLRALHGLLVLARRWLDLIRGLRRGLSAAEEAGDLAAQAWVRHELGSLHLCADDSEAAAKQLGQALRLQQRLGQATGTCATRHNLDSAQRDLATRAASKPWSRRRLLRLTVVAGAFTLLAVGGTGMALALGDDSPSPPIPTTTSTTAGTSETTDTTTTPPTTSTTTSTTTGSTETTDTTTTSTQGTIDVTEPAVTLDEPSDGSVIEPGTPVFSGTAGVEPGDADEVLVEIVEIVDENVRRPLDVSPLSASVVEGTWTATPTSALPDGSYEATVRQSDGAGNTGSATVSFSVATPTPTPPPDIN
jgi:Bacterial Ig-like domain